MTFEDKLHIYDILMTNFSVGESVPLSMVGNFLSKHDLTPASFGYEKLLDLFQDLPELCTLHSAKPRLWLPPVWDVTFLTRPAIPDDGEAAQAAAKAEPMRPAENMEPMRPAENTEPVQPAVAAEPVSPEADTKPGRLQSEDFSVLPETMESENVAFTDIALNNLGFNLTGQQGSRATPEMIAQVKADYLKAREHNAFVHDLEHSAYTFRLSAPSAKGDLLIASLCQSSRETGSPWFVKFIGPDFGGAFGREGGSRRTGKPGDALRSFGYLGNMNDFLRSLAEHVQEEPWNFRGAADEYPILHQYINYTFYRLQELGRVCIAEDGSFAAFNTGLQSRRLGEDVFAYFVPNDPDAESPWKFLCFCSTDSGDPNERRCYKAMVNVFKEPEPAFYFTKITNLLFDPACEVHLSSDHIFKDNCDRLPLKFLKRECSGMNQDAEAVVAEIEAEHDWRKRKDLFRKLGGIITDDLDLFSEMNDGLQRALDRTVKRIRRNYKLAVPCFFPTRSVMSMMLPLSFTASSAPNLVLVCERTLSGDYIGQTILTLSMAYIDARLLCQPGSEWLNTDRIVNSEETYTGDDEL